MTRKRWLRRLKNLLERRFLRISKNFCKKALMKVCGNSGDLSYQHYDPGDHHEDSEKLSRHLHREPVEQVRPGDTSTSINTQMDSLIPASKIANLSQGTFVGSVADNFGEEIEQKIFHARIIVDSAKVSEEMKAYKKIPVINEFRDADGNDIMQQQIDRNYSQIKADVLQIIEDEITRIKNDPELRHLIPQQEEEENNDGE